MLPFLMDNKILMPKATALWLKYNTDLTIDQICDFCNLDIFTVEALTQDHIKSHNPIVSGQLTKDEIEKGEKNPLYKLKNMLNLSEILPKKNQRKYIPMAFKKQKPNIIAWFLIKNQMIHFTDEQITKIAKIISSNFNFVKKYMDLAPSVDDYIKYPLDPVSAGLCSKDDVQQIVIFNDFSH